MESENLRLESVKVVGEQKVEDGKVGSENIEVGRSNQGCRALRLDRIVQRWKRLVADECGVMKCPSTEKEGWNHRI